jgi:hypothetical protein
MEMGSVGCKACKARMALDAPGSSCNDYYICEPGKRTTYHFCPGEMDCYWPQRSCCTDRRRNPLVCNGSVLLPPNQLRFGERSPIAHSPAQRRHSHLPSAVLCLHRACLGAASCRLSGLGAAVLMSQGAAEGSLGAAMQHAEYNSRR